MTSSLAIRRAGPDQVAQIRDLSMRAYEKWVSVTARKPRPMTADYEASVQTNRFDFLYEDDRLVGLIETVQQDDDLMIVNVAIEPDCQGKGYGTRLMKHAEQLAEASGLLATRLYTNKLMTENIALYERLGSDSIIFAHSLSVGCSWHTRPGGTVRGWISGRRRWR